MAVTLTKIPDGFCKKGNRKSHTFDVSFTGSYPVTGEPITPLSVGMRVIEQVQGAVTEAAGRTTELAPSWNEATNKLQLYTSNGAAPASFAEKTAVAYAGTTRGRLEFIGR